MSHHRHQLAAAWMIADDAVIFSIYTSIYGVHEPIASPTRRMLDKGARKINIPLWIKGNLDGIIHATGHYRFNRSSIQCSAKDM